LATNARVGKAGVPTPVMRAIFDRFLGPLVIDPLLRPRVAGWNRIPRDRPFLLVANHSGGGIADIGCIARLAIRESEKPLALTGLAHPVAFWVPGAAWFLRQLGAVPSTYDDARRALARGVSVLVFPGGDHEAFRPIWQANEVQFAGRQGFLRIARDAWVPIVPLGISGSHFTLPILWRSRLLPWLTVLPRLAGLKRLPVTLTWIVGVLALALALASHGALVVLAAILAFSLCPLVYFVPYVPWTVRMHFGAPMEPAELFGPRGSDAPLDPAYERVVTAVQAGLVASRGSAR
jgi:1-acyl-sn-glycerol-3-phosphate acyltransferase